MPMPEKPAPTIAMWRARSSPNIRFRTYARVPLHRADGLSSLQAMAVRTRTPLLPRMPREERREQLLDVGTAADRRARDSRASRWRAWRARPDIAKTVVYDLFAQPGRAAPGTLRARAGARAVRRGRRDPGAAARRRPARAADREPRDGARGGAPAPRHLAPDPAAGRGHAARPSARPWTATASGWSGRSSRWWRGGSGKPGPDRLDAGADRRDPPRAVRERDPPDADQARQLSARALRVVRRPSWRRRSFPASSIWKHQRTSCTFPVP